jgi:hypothetical protein
VTGQSPRLLDQVRARMRRLGLASRTEEAYVSWIRRFIAENASPRQRQSWSERTQPFLAE